MCKELCDEYEEMQSCPDCGMLICFDTVCGDDVIRPAYVTSSGDLYCDRHGKQHDKAEHDYENDEGFYDPYEDAIESDK